MTKYYAVYHSGGPITKDHIFASGETYSECSERAAKESGWRKEPGSVAPYSIVSANWFKGEVEK